MMKAKKNISAAIYHIFMILFCFVMLYPVIWMVSSSFKPTADIYRFQKELLPRTWTVSNFIRGWQGTGGISFTVFFKNTLFITITATFGTILTSALAAYSFGRLAIPLKKFWFAVMMLTMMLPAQILMVPQYILYNWFGWIGSFKAVIIPCFAGGGFYIYLLVQFMKSLPKELDEAATIDGCNRYSIFFRIILPLLKPAITTATIFAFYWKWEDFMGPLLYLTQPKQYTVPLVIKIFSDSSQSTDWGALFAMATLSLVPVVLIFFLFQKYIVEGISTSGLKG